MKKIFLFAIFFFLLSQIFCKVVKKHVQPYIFEKRGTHYLTRFYSDKGSISINIKTNRFFFSKNETNFQDNSTFLFVIVNNENFDLFMSESCIQAIQKFVFQTEEIPIFNENYEKEIIIKQNEPKLYHFILMDCDLKWKKIIGEDITLLSNIFNIEIAIKNNDNSHFSLEDQQLIIPCVVIILVISVYLCFNFKKLYAYYKKHEIIDYPLTIIFLALILENGALFLQLMNLIYYQNNGFNSYFLSFMHLFFETSCNFLFTLIFIFVAWGWSINYLDILNFDYFLPTFAILGAANVSLVVLTKIVFDNDEKPSIGLGLLNYIYLIYKIGFFGYFLSGVAKTYGLARIKIRSFVVKFTILGILFFVSYGILMFFTKFLELYNQKKLLLVGNEVINMLITISLSNLFNSKVYNELSFKGKNVLPMDNLPKLI